MALDRAVLDQSHVELRLYEVDPVPGFERRFLSQIVDFLFELTELFLADLFVLPHMPGLWRLKQSINDTVKMTPQMAPKRRYAELCALLVFCY